MVIMVGESVLLLVGANNRNAIWLLHSVQQNRIFVAHKGVKKIK